MINFIKDPIEKIAKDLLGCIIAYETKGNYCSGIIVDVEIYYGDIDEASHAYGGKRTPRMSAMLLEGGHLYLYEMRGHVLMNFVCGQKDETLGIMIRAIEPLEGIKTMEKRRQQTGVNISNGPGKLTAALGINMSLYGTLIGDHIKLIQDTKYKPKEIIRTHRIGIPNKGTWTDAPLRFYVKGNPYCSHIKKQEVQIDYGWCK